MLHTLPRSARRPLTRSSCPASVASVPPVATSRTPAARASRAVIAPPPPPTRPKSLSARSCSPPARQRPLARPLPPARRGRTHLDRVGPRPAQPLPPARAEDTHVPRVRPPPTRPRAGGRVPLADAAVTVPVLAEEPAVGHGGERERGVRRASPRDQLCRRRRRLRAAAAAAQDLRSQAARIVPSRLPV